MALLSNVPTANVPASMSTQFFPVPRKSFKKRDINELVLGQLQSGFYRASPDFRNGILSESTTGGGPPNLVEAMMALHKAAKEKLRPFPRRRQRFPSSATDDSYSSFASAQSTQTDPVRERSGGTERGTQTDPQRRGGTERGTQYDPPRSGGTETLPFMPEVPHGFPRDKPRPRASSEPHSRRRPPAAPSVRFPDSGRNNGNEAQTVQDQELQNNEDQNTQNSAYNTGLRVAGFLGNAVGNLAASAAAGLKRGAASAAESLSNQFDLDGPHGEGYDPYEGASAVHMTRSPDRGPEKSPGRGAGLPQVNLNNEAEAPEADRGFRNPAAINELFGERVLYD